MRRTRDRLTYANVMSTIAVFLVLAGGSAVAVINGKKLKNGSVATKKLRNKAVTQPKLGDQAVGAGQLGEGAVTQGKLGDAAVNTPKIADRSVTSAKLADNAVGPAQLDLAGVGLLRSGRVVSNPAVGQTLTPPLVSAAGINVAGYCSLDAGANHTALVTISGPAGSVFSGIESGPSLPPTGINASTGPTAAGATLMTSGLAGARKQMTVSVVAPAGVVNLNILVAINTPDFNTPCLFSATGIVS